MVRRRRDIGRREREPLTRTVVVKLGHIEDPVIERTNSAPARQSPWQVRHVAVDVFVSLVVTRVHDDLAVLRLLDPRPFMLKTTDRCALDGRRFRLERIDLHHPAEAVGFVGFDIGIEPRVSRVPPDARSEGSDAVAALHGVSWSEPPSSGRKSR